ncbi:carboxyl-terminal processing protease [Pustulibacterium marinum]|uniref:Carboxyl-terminal processing protease n=1 Tax=Pustulibacterium marinum TaxID=1224947 RepID=A0A1I7EST7_9FLAO|nr:S41 family peptidase [Pustulibacterium marinum]SFU26987.1 carboxyl-terminal processing protease [Pustulibacterium marinum]
MEEYKDESLDKTERATRKSKLYYFLPLLIAIALAAGIFIGGKMRFSDTPERFFTSNSNKDKLNRLIDYIDYEYVDDVNTDSIVDVTVNNILSKLDPHSVYIPNSQTEKVAENMKGEFVGVGISFRMLKDSLTVIRTIEGGPAIDAGIQAGDRILTADKDTLFGKHLSNTYVIDKLKGVSGSEIALTVYRKSTHENLNINLKRAAVPIKSVDAFFMLDDDIGYVKVNRFAESTYKEFRTAVTLLKHNGAKAIALDLRDNPGGYMEIAEQIADEFLTKGKLIVFTRNKKGEENKTYATAKGDFEDSDVYVLINEKSASASEIVAGALQDNDVGTIVGRRSFGKGLVQREMPMPDGSAVRLTVARYYTPTGRSIQRSYANGVDDYFDDFYKRYENGELQSADSIKVADSLKFKTAKGKIVYGGGGIIPDEFVPLQSTQEEQHINMVLKSELVSAYVFDYLDDHRNELKNISEKEFVSTFEITDDLVDGFQQYLYDRGIGFSVSLYKEDTKRYLKAGMAQQLYGDNTYQKILKQKDTMLQKVITLHEAKSE